MSAEHTEQHWVPGQQPHKRSTYQHGAREYLARLIRENPEVGSDDIFPMFMSEVLKHPNWTATAIQYYFDAQYKYATKGSSDQPRQQKSRADRRPSRPASPEEIAAAERSAERTVQSAIEFYKIEGTPVLDCTGRIIREQIAVHAAAIDEQKLRVRFLTALVEDLSDDQTPRAAGKADQATALHRKLFGA